MKGKSKRSKVGTHGIGATKAKAIALKDITKECLSMNGIYKINYAQKEATVLAYTDYFKTFNNIISI